VLPLLLAVLLPAAAAAGPRWALSRRSALRN
jgi:hypothetical protein